MKQTNKEGGSSPWGTIQHVDVIAEGIEATVTAGHGGIWLSHERRSQMPDQLRTFEPFCGLAGWYEEDCDWCVVVLSFPELFKPHQVDRSRDTLIHLASNPRYAAAAVYAKAMGAK